MELVYYIQNCAFGLSILLLLLLNQPGRAGRLPFNRYTYIGAIYADAALLVLELLTKFSVLHVITYPHWLLDIIVCIFYSLNPVPLGLWTVYLIGILKKGRGISGVDLFAMSLPTLANFVLALASLRYGLTFAIDAQGIYHRGPYFFIMSLLCYSYLMVYMVLLLVYRKTLRRDILPPLFSFIIPPVAGGIVQTLFNGVTVVWVALAFSLLIFHIRMQSEQNMTDHLTGLANKRRFDEAVHDLFAGDARRSVGGIAIDVDNFKMVNDCFGHDTGDRVLETVGRVLRQCVRKNDVAARTGGDEFVILMETASRAELESAAARIRRHLAQYNEKGLLPFPIHLSMGLGVSGECPETDAGAFLRLLDTRMYEAKRRGGISVPRREE